MCFHLKVEPPQAWYYQNFPNSRTLVILLQVDLASNDELEIVREDFYKTKNTLVFAWFSIFGVERGHYYWLRGLIHQLSPNNKVDYLVHTIQHIL